MHLNTISIGITSLITLEYKRILEKWGSVVWLAGTIVFLKTWGGTLLSYQQKLLTTIYVYSISSKNCVRSNSDEHIIE